PRMHAFQRPVQVLQRIGHAEAQIAFSVIAKRRPRKTSYSGVIHQRISQLLRFPARLADIGEHVERALGNAAREALDPVEPSYKDAARLLKFRAHSIHRRTVARKRM